MERISRHLAALHKDVDNRVFQIVSALEEKEKPQSLEIQHGNKSIPEIQTEPNQKVETEPNPTIKPTFEVECLRDTQYINLVQQYDDVNQKYNTLIQDHNTFILKHDTFIQEHENLIQKHKCLGDDANESLERFQRLQREFDLSQMDWKSKVSSLCSDITSTKTALLESKEQHFLLHQSMEKQRNEITHAIKDGVALESGRMLDKIVQLGTEISKLEGSRLSDETQMNQLKHELSIKEQEIQKLNQTKRDEEAKQQRIKEEEEETKQNKNISIHPAAQGNQGEMETEFFLKNAFGSFLSVENVSKGGQGKEMDLKLVSRDQSIVIRIDCKNYFGILLPEKEINRFNKDLDELGQFGMVVHNRIRENINTNTNTSTTSHTNTTASPLNNEQTPQTQQTQQTQQEYNSHQTHICILFSKPPVKGNEVFNKSKRGSIYRYHVGMWSFHALLECIHDGILSVLKDRMMDSYKTTLVQSHENLLVEEKITSKLHAKLVFEQMMDLIRYYNGVVGKFSDSIKDFASRTAVHNREIAKCLQSAHSQSPDLISQGMLISFEAQIPKQARGRPPTIQKASQKGQSSKKETKEDLTATNKTTKSTKSTKSTTSTTPTTSTASTLSKNKRKLNELNSYAFSNAKQQHQTNVAIKREETDGKENALRPKDNNKRMKSE